jgi:hypothetical protein
VGAEGIGDQHASAARRGPSRPAVQARLVPVLIRASWISLTREAAQVDAIAPARSGEAQALAVNRTRDRLNETLPLIQEALARLRQVLAPEGD